MVKNHVAFVLDNSSSMGVIADKTVDVFNKWVETVKAESIRQGQETTVTLITFDNNAKLKYFNADVRTLKKMQYSDYRPNGMTALFDGVCLAVDNLEKTDDHD